MKSMLFIFALVVSSSLSFAGEYDPTPSVDHSFNNGAVTYTGSQPESQCNTCPTPVLPVPQPVWHAPVIKSPTYGHCYWTPIRQCKTIYVKRCNVQRPAPGPMPVPVVSHGQKPPYGHCYWTPVRQCKTVFVKRCNVQSPMVPSAFYQKPGQCQNSCNVPAVRWQSSNGCSSSRQLVTPVASYRRVSRQCSNGSMSRKYDFNVLGSRLWLNFNTPGCNR